MRVLILGLDTFAQKNRAQLRELGERGCRFDVVVNDLRGDSRIHFREFVQDGHRLVNLVGNPLKRLKRVAELLAREHYDVVELYATGRMAFLYVQLLRWRRQPFLVVERGDIDLMPAYDRLTRLSMTQAYRHAKLVVYKETYMPPLLRRWRDGGLAFVPNAVEVPDGPTADDSGRFIWVNRLIPQRRPEWFVRAFTRPELQTAPLTVMGFEERANLAPEVTAVQDRVRAAAPPHAELLPFADPTPLYARASFFAFAAERVFGNNALLEAMARGLIPIVNAADGVDQLVTDGVNGFVTAFDEASFADGLARAHALTPDERARLSAAARRTVSERYSLRAWTDSMHRAYGELS